MADDDMDPSLLSGEALRRWNLRSPQQSTKSGERRPSGLIAPSSFRRNEDNALTRRRPPAILNVATAVTFGVRRTKSNCRCQELPNRQPPIT